MTIFELMIHDDHMKRIEKYTIYIHVFQNVVSSKSIRSISIQKGWYALEKKVWLNNFDTC